MIADVERDLTKVADALSVRRGDVQLGEVLRSEGRRVAGDILVQRVRDFNQSIADLNDALATVAGRLKAISDKSKRQEIEQYYFARMSENLRRLNVKTVPLSAVEKIDCRVRDTGSDQPRALLAYDFAVFDTIRRYSTSFIAPMVIDSPLQQDQDDENARLMLEFIAEKATSNGQVVLGTVSMHGVDIGDGSLIELTDELSLLRAADFEEINDEFNVFFDAVT